MTTTAVIDGTYSDFKIVKTRSVFQMVIEGPIERAAEAVAMFGVPQPGQEIHVAVARLQVPTPIAHEVPAPNARPQETERSLSAGAAPAREPKSDAARERFKMLGEPEQMVAKCAMHCADPYFRDWLAIIEDHFIKDSEEAAQVVRFRCGIKSRSELASNGAAARKWQQMVTDYDLWRGMMAELRS